MPARCTVYPGFRHKRLFFVLSDFESGRASVERDITFMDRSSTIEHIRNGEISHVVAVIEVCLDEHLSNDVTEEFLREAGRWNDDDPPLYGADRIEWMADHARKLRAEAV